MGIVKSDFAAEVAALKFRTGINEVWRKTNLLREPLFKQSILIISIYGIANAVLQALCKANYISVTTKDTLFPLLYLSPLIGGMYITGELNGRRAGLAAVFTVVFGAFIFMVNKFCFNIHTLLEIFQFIPGSWLIIWWVATQPELMGKFGLRKSNILKDLLTTSILVIFITAYTVHFFTVIGFKPEFKPDKMAAYFSGNVITCMFVSNYCYCVWNILKKRGATTLQLILALVALVSIITGPTIFTLSFMGAMKPVMGVGAFLWTVMFTLTAMHFTFNGLKNSLPSTFLIAMVMLLIKMAGVG